MTWGPTTHRVREPYTGPREHNVIMHTRSPGGTQATTKAVCGGDAEVIAFLKALVAELEGCTVSS